MSENTDLARELMADAAGHRHDGRTAETRATCSQGYSLLAIADAVEGILAAIKEQAPAVATLDERQPVGFVVLDKDGDVHGAIWATRAIAEDVLATCARGCGSQWAPYRVAAVYELGEQQA